MSRVLIASLVGLAAGVSTTATAGPIEGLEVMRTYNLVTLGNLQNSSEVEGRTHVGGNLSGSSNYNVGGAGFQAASDAPKLQVGGNIGSGWQNIQGGGSVVAGGNISQINLNGGYYTVKAGGTISGVNANGNSLQSNAAVDVPMFDDDFLSLSTALASLSDTGGSTTIQGQNRIFNPVADQNGVAVFNVDSLTNLLASNGNDIVSGLGFGAGSSDLDTIVINVADTEFSLQDNFINGANEALGSTIIWNFVNAERLTFNREFWGSVLAPKAFGTNNSPINGSVVFGSANLNSEIHLGTYSGNNLSFEEELPPGEVPAPAALALFGLGIAGVAGLRVRSKLAAS